MKRVARGCAYAVILLMLAGITALTFQSVRRIRYSVSGMEYATRETDDFVRPFESPDDVLIQYFKPTRPHLWFARMRLSNGGAEGTSGWTMNVRMYDDRDQLVAENTIDESAFPNGGYFELWFDGGVRKGRTYRLEFRQSCADGGAWPSPFTLYTAPSRLRENVRCTLRGEAQDYAVDVVYHYNFFDKEDLYVTLLCDALIVALLACFHVLFVRRGKSAPRALNAALWLVTPALMFAAAEWIAGNLPTIRPVYVLANLCLYYALFAAATLLFRRSKWGALGFIAASLLLALGYRFVNEFRGSPIMFSDLMSIGTALAVMGTYVYNVYLPLALPLQGCIALAIVWGFCGGPRWPGGRRGFALRAAGIGGVTGALVALTLYDGALLLPDGGSGAKINILQIPSFVNVELEYQERGVVWLLYLEARELNVKPPEGYSLQRVAEITEAYREPEELAGGIQPENIIVIMNESLSDMAAWGNLAAQEEVLPFIHSLSENTVKGLTQVHVFGAGTSNTEYEALTGNAVCFLPVGGNAYEFFCRRPEFGLVQTLKSQGYRTFAFHQSLASNYNRKAVYAMMGFDEYIARENWNGVFETVGSLASDESAYRRVSEVIEAQGDAPVFAFLVTLQNHGGYAGNEYEGRVKLNYGEPYPEAELYLALLNESDRAFRQLVERYEQVEKPTMIVMFGDHLPNLDDGFYDKLLGEDPIVRQKLYQTPYVVWTNYPTPSAEGQDMSVNYLGSTIVRMAGLKTTAYDRYLLALKEKLPIIGNGYVCDAQGDWYTMDALPPEYQTLIDEYKIVEYNRVFDRESMAELYTVE